MLVVDTDYRGHGIAKKLVKLIVEEMVNQGADEILLETEVHNKAAIALYESFGFLKTNKLHHYYLNQTSAYQLILPITEKSTTRWEFLPPIE